MYIEECLCTKSSLHLYKHLSTDWILNLIGIFYSTISGPKRPGSSLKKTFDYHFNFSKELIVFLVLGFKPLFSHSCESTVPFTNGAIGPCEITLIGKIKSTYWVLNVAVLKLVQVPQGIHFTLIIIKVTKIILIYDINGELLFPQKDTSI